MKTNSKTQAGVKVSANIKAGGLTPNHVRKLLVLKASTGIKAGGLTPNHARKLLVLKVSTGIKAGEGIVNSNHNRRLA
jgi:hypothetical protein